MKDYLFIAPQKSKVYYFVSHGKCNCGKKLASCIKELEENDEKSIMEELYSSIVRKRETRKFSEVSQIFGCKCWSITNEHPQGNFHVESVSMFDEE